MIHAVYERIVIEGPRFVRLRLTPAAYRRGPTLALPEAVMARPTVSGSRTWVTPDRRLVSRDMRDSPAHVEAPGGRPQGRLSEVVRYRRGVGVRHQPRAPAPPSAPLPRRRPRGRRAAVAPTAPAPAGRLMPCATGSLPCGSSSLPGAWTRVRPPLPGTSGAKACRPRRPRPSGVSSTPPGWSCPSRASARAAPGGASRPRRPMSCGSPTSPTGAWPTRARSRSAPGSTTPAYRGRAEGWLVVPSLEPR